MTYTVSSGTLNLTQLNPNMVKQCAGICIGASWLNSIYTVSKNCANLLLSELRHISINFDNFWQNDGKEAKIMLGALIPHLT